jgi:hypothetical protein
MTCPQPACFALCVSITGTHPAAPRLLPLPACIEHHEDSGDGDDPSASGAVGQQPQQSKDWRDTTRKVRMRSTATILRFDEPSETV